MKLRKLTRDDVQIEVLTSPEEVPIRGNARASGDDAEDKALEDELIARCNAGDEWAWCAVCVRVTWGDFVGTALLGCCSFESEVQFRADPYFADLVKEAIDELNDKIASTFEAIKTLVEA